MTDLFDTPRPSRLIDFGEFVANRSLGREAPEVPPESRQMELEFPAPPRPLSARAIEHRRRMLTHLVSGASR